MTDRHEQHEKEITERLDALTAATRRFSEGVAQGARPRTDRELEKGMEERQAQDEADLALGRLVRDLLLSDLMRLSTERNTLLNECGEWRQDRQRLDWLSRPENYDVEFILSQGGYRIQQPRHVQQEPGVYRIVEVLLTSRDWPTLREALDEAIEKEAS